MNTIPEQLHQYLDRLTEAMYEMGYRDALHDIATRQAELDAAWRPIGRASYEEKVAARIAESQRRAEQVRAELNRRPVAIVEWPRLRYRAEVEGAA